MKVKITEERECCQPNDLKPFLGKKPPGHTLKDAKFCIHCGQTWIKDQYENFGQDSGFVLRKAEVS